MTACGCWPTDFFGDGEIPEHANDCPRNYGHLHTAEDVVRARLFVMHWGEGAARLQRQGAFLAHPEITAAMARGITARAIELGLEAS